jgi:hypothetical protein
MYFAVTRCGYYNKVVRYSRIMAYLAKAATLNHKRQLCSKKSSMLSGEGLDEIE